MYRLSIELTFDDQFHFDLFPGHLTFSIRNILKVDICFFTL